jgi:RES domain-containing protein
VKLWRIAAETRSYAADDLSGAGSAVAPGRWNMDGEPVVYSAPTRAIAVLETSAHVDSSGLPLNRFLIEIDVPESVWADRVQVAIDSLPEAWCAIPAGMASARVGSGWLASLRSAILIVPSVIVPEESAALINPRHPDGARLSAKVVRKFEYDLLFRPH